ncbi:MAG TPA: chitobiase/beta-hexosaminidase C-terminal domain-containing protein, partial [Rhodothermales bacterium]|nr:chitobiase/beta-hexosaminidase C-terminal domain-containing protein [Rhodothermales bacterium]
STEQDAINVRSQNVIIDHCSVSWGTDETLSVIGAATNVTIQWCLITESLNNSVHHKGPHGYGTLLTTTGDVTIHHSAYAFHHSRNPRPKDVMLDFRNNLVYGYGDEAGYNYADFTRMNYVGNYIVPLDYSRDPACAFNLGGSNARFFVDDNFLRGVEEDWDLICTPEDLPHEAAQAQVRMPTPFAVPSVSTDAPERAYQQVLSKAGAARPTRDVVDERVIALIEAGEGRIIDSQTEVGGWPPLKPAAPPRDDDRDGMSDAWETQYGLDPTDGSDQAGDLDDDGYTNLEEFLNDTDPVVPFRWVPPPAMQPASGTAFTDSVLAVTIVPTMPEVPVYYTLDGSEPTVASSRYKEPIRLTTSAHVRAKAVQAGTETTAAFAQFDRLVWHDAVKAPSATLEPGLRYTYYETDDWDDGPPPEALKPVASGTAHHVDFSQRQRNSRFALLFDGYLDVPRDGIYAFYLDDNYRGRLYINDQLVTIGRTAGSPPGQIALRAGKHLFHLRTLHEGMAREPRLEWTGPDMGRQPIPGEVFFQTTINQ